MQNLFVRKNNKEFKTALVTSFILLLRFKLLKYFKLMTIDSKVQKVVVEKDLQDTNQNPNEKVNILK